MKISLITITYNSDITLVDTLQSVLHQDQVDLEYIIIDGGSKDKTLSIVEEYSLQFGERLKWISEKDNGIYDAMNKGIKMATGDIIGILNSDDIFEDFHVLSDVVKAFDENTDAIFGNLYFVNSDDTDSVIRIWKGSPRSSMRKGWHPAHPTFYVRRDIYEKYGLFDTTFDVSADFELMLRFIEKYQIRTKYLDRYMIKMRIGGESTGSLKNIVKGNYNIMRAFRKNDIRVSYFYPLMRLLPKLINILKLKLKI